MLKKNKQKVYLLSFLFSLLYAQTPNSRLLNSQPNLSGAFFNDSESVITNSSDTFSPANANLVPFSIDSIDLRHMNKLMHFGYDFFNKRDTVNFWENLPTPSNYFLGPGDELVISIWGETQIRSNFTISRDGKIFDPKVGLLNLSGKTIEEASSYLKNQYGRIYSTLKTKNPTSFMDVSLGKLKSINVNFVGEVKYPGVYPVHPFSTVITGIIQAGGIDTTGSLRNVQLKRNNSLVSKIDLYSYLLKGEISKDIQLRDQDVVVVKPRLSKIIVDSSVVNPGIYEATQEENIYDIINHAGEYLSKASNFIGIERISTEKDGEKSYDNFYVSRDSSKNISAKDVVKISVFDVMLNSNDVEIIGQVKSPGKYYFYDNMTLRDLLSMSIGFEDTTYWKSIFLGKAEIIRLDPQSSTSNVINVNLNDIINSEKDYNLQSKDKVVVHSNINFFDKKYIKIIGEVNIPGSYPLIKQKETLLSVIQRAGNFTPKALENGIAIYRDKKYFNVNENNANYEQNSFLERENSEKLRVAWSNFNLSLMPGDSIIVKEKPGAIYVLGNVYNPGLIEYRKNKKLNYYLGASGGIKENTDKNGIIVLKPNGVVVPRKWYSRPSIEDGSTIIVNSKEFSEPINTTQLATSWISIISSMITTILLAQQLQSSN